MIDITTEFPEFNPYDELTTLCPIIDRAEHVEETDAKHAYAHLSAAQYRLAGVVSAINDSSIAEQGTREESLETVQTCLDSAITHLGELQDDIQAELTSNRTPDDAPVKRHPSAAVSRADTAYTHVERATDAPTIETIHTNVVEARTATERAQTQLSTLLSHEQYEDCLRTVAYKEPDAYEINAEGIDIPAFCMLCGKQFEEVYEFSGVFDPDKRDYVMRR